ncbi:MAG: hypothetical protein ACFFDN_05450 [Candidatus Hodarchaeota archaeon]
MKLSKKIKYIKEILLEIISQLNLSFNKSPNFENLATILYDNNLLDEIYYRKIKLLDSINENELVNSKSLENDLNAIKMYLEMKFYHYI